MKNELKRFQIQVPQKVVDLFDALCDSADVDRSTGFHCLLLDFFAGNPYMQSQFGHADYMHWQHKTREFVINHCP